MSAVETDPDTAYVGPFPAPAKLNLFLRITGRRADGYHELQTLFQFLDYGDRLWFRLRDDGQIRRIGGVPGLAESDDLVVRAARLLVDMAGLPGVEIRVEKNMPAGAGLGGGSSDAATTLRALDQIGGLGLGVERLSELGLGLGADVPVFVRGEAAWAEGVGEILTTAEPDEPVYLVVTPPVNVSTAAIFSDSALTRSSPPIKISDFLAHGAGNDCAPVVRRRFPQVAEAMDWLARFAVPRLTGTGASVFAPFTTRAAAREALDQLPAGWRGFVSQGRNRSPLVDALARHG